MRTMKNTLARTMYVAAMLLLIATISACSSNTSKPSAEPNVSQPVVKTYYVFDTIVTVKVYDGQATEQNFAEIEALLDVIDQQMNPQRENSELDQVNHQAGIGPVKVSDETIKVVSAALDFAALSDGNFNPAVGPLVNLWAIGNGGESVPPQDQINEAVSLLDYTKVRVDKGNKTIELLEPGMSLDLGAIAKGYAGDRMVEYLRSKGFESAIVDLGGNVIAMGEKEGGVPFSIGIQDPEKKRGNHLALLKIKDQTVVSSGVYERFFEFEGKSYHHILDTRLGFPVDNGLLSVTVVTDVSMNADALSTAAFVMGTKNGLEFIEQQDHTEALFVTQDHKVYATSGLQNIVEITNDEYKLVK